MRYDLMNILLRAPEGVAAANPATAALTAEPVAAPAPAVAAAAAAENWYKDMPADHHPYIANKGWKGPNDVLESYVNLEKLMGADKAGNAVVLPKENATPAERDAFYAKMGRPEKPENYDFKLPEGTPKDLANAAAAEFHKAGLSKSQGETVAQWYQQQEKAAQAAYIARSDREMQQLQQEYGADYPNKTEIGRRGARVLGIDNATLEKMEQAMGTATMMKMFIKVGENAAEGSSPGSTSSTTAMGGLTPSSARSRIETLKTDSSFMAKLLSPNPKVRDEAKGVWEDLHKALGG